MTHVALQMHAMGNGTIPYKTYRFDLSRATSDWVFGQRKLSCCTTSQLLEALAYTAQFLYPIQQSPRSRGLVLGILGQLAVRDKLGEIVGADGVLHMDYVEQRWQVRTM